MIASPLLFLLLVVIYAPLVRVYAWFMATSERAEAFRRIEANDTRELDHAKLLTFRVFILGIGMAMVCGATTAWWMLIPLSLFTFGLFTPVHREVFNGHVGCGLLIDKGKPVTPKLLRVVSTGYHYISPGNRYDRYWLARYAWNGTPVATKDHWQRYKNDAAYRAKVNYAGSKAERFEHICAVAGATINGIVPITNILLNYG